MFDFGWCEHTFGDSGSSRPGPDFRRAIERRALWAAEDAARELPNLSLEDALQLVRLYAERGSPKYEKAALRWLERYLAESSPRLEHFAEITADLAKREGLGRIEERDEPDAWSSRSCPASETNPRMRRPRIRSVWI